MLSLLCRSPASMAPVAAALLPTRSAAAAAAATRTTRSVAVIGAGAAGLVAARELRREGLDVVVFERGSSIGGTWVYTSGVESDPLGQDPAREVVHSSLYESLRTNLPRECMGFFDYPFVAGGEGTDRRRFPGHKEVLRYLENFARDFDLNGMVRFGTEVVEVEREGGARWSVRSRRLGGGGEESEVYDGVVVCNGHYTEPRVAEIPGIDIWPGKQIHSHNYRVPEQFLDQVVLLIGSSASAVDISRDISRFAKEVHIASRSDLLENPRKQPGYDNMWLHSMIEMANKDGTVIFQDGTSFVVDVILYCTGYRYHFPFLKMGVVTVDDNRVDPLYKHVFPPPFAPGISFIGIPWKVAPFPLFELQSKWVAGVISGRITLPSEEEMMRDVIAYYEDIEAAGYPKRYTHNLSGRQFDYDDWLAATCGHSAVEEWRKQMYAATSKNRVVRPENYRDEWEDDDLSVEAQNDFKKFLILDGEA